MFDDIKAIPMQDFIALRGHTGGILKTGRVIILNGDIGPFSPEDEAQICGFVERGGGLVCIGDAAEAYHEYPLLGEALGNIHGICAPRSEIIARVVTPDHYLICSMVFPLTPNCCGAPPGAMPPIRWPMRAAMDRGASSVQPWGVIPRRRNTLYFVR
ncbi:MAG: hypothetical protein E6I93_09900 [Chloroflexi bacterium]|nr:MAG: hypothetical protein E6I93_09900 [Chloroflexota bacterium]